ncbi:MAG: saccharopine dehydrogenase-like NADP-dependent oxidoreductase [Candidatus Azotimanducaceae bacterium]|jgi:saccharopine dehydrogenase-like NADP-dependent oxidoreductase
MEQKHIAIVGAGKIGAMICRFLLSCGEYRITLIDASAEQLHRIPDEPGLEKRTLDVADHDGFIQALQGHFAVLSATPYFMTEQIAKAAVAAKVHYLDLTEDVASTACVKTLAENATTALIPQCGLAPGFISIVANDLAKDFDELESIRMCVGALPQFPSNSLNYNLTWSTDGVINEYCEPCVAIKDGQLTTVSALEHLEHFSLDGINYESFNTSGGIGTLAETLAGRVKNLCYQTIRYPGHRDIMKTLLHDLQLRNRRDLLKDVFENAVPATLQDVVLIFVTVSGRKQGQLIQQTYANKVYGQTISEQACSAIQVTTAASICAVLDMLAKGDIRSQGFVCQEEISLDKFLGNRFGRYYGRSQPADDIHHAA